MTMADAPPFRRIALLGLGLIGSSVARAVRLHGLAGEIVGHAKSGATRERAMELGFLDRAEADPAEAVRGADLVMICTPLGAYAALARAMLPGLAEDAVVTDVGSVKACVLRDLQPLLDRKGAG